MEDRINERKRAFIQDFGRLSDVAIVRKHITLGPCCIFDEDAHFELKQEVAEHFDIHPSEVVVVGSSKLGFSIAPQKRYRHFGDESDIDVAIVSPTLFDSIWHSVRRFRRDGGYWPEFDDFSRYLFGGWIRPDKLPRSRTFPLRDDWWNFFIELTKSERYGRYKVRGALYRTWLHIEDYQKVCIEDCRQDQEQNK
jgi:hypothetical protein